MANPAQRPAGTETENYADNKRRRQQLISVPATGVSIFHVHDVAEMVDVVKVINSISRLE